MKGVGSRQTLKPVENLLHESRLAVALAKKHGTRKISLYSVSSKIPRFSPKGGNGFKKKKLNKWKITSSRPTSYIKRPETAKAAPPLKSVEPKSGENVLSDGKKSLAPVSERKTQSVQTAPRHVYEDAATRLSISQERIQNRFEQPELYTNFAHQLQADEHFLDHLSPALASLVKLQFSSMYSMIEHHQSHLAMPLDTSTKELHGRQMIDNLDRCIEIISKTLSDPAADPDKHELWSRTVKELEAERGLILQVMDDDSVNLGDGKLDWQACVELKRNGYDLTPAILSSFSHLGDQHLVSGSEKEFGSGKLHTVSMMSYDTGQQTVRRVFKPEDASDTSPFDEVSGPENYLEKDKPRFAARHLAGQVVEKHLGLKLMVGMEIAMHKGQLGMLMEIAEGRNPLERKADEDIVPDLPYNDPSNPEVSANIRKNLVAAEWLDGICGQMDRHPGNYFIDPESGKVKLIDNDIAFIPGLEVIKEPSHSEDYPNHINGSRAGLPELIDQDLYDKLKSLDESILRQDLEGLLTDKEIDSTIVRINLMKSHADNLAQKGLIVSDWGPGGQYGNPPMSTYEILKQSSNTQGYYTTALSAVEWARDVGRLVQVKPKKPPPPKPKPRKKGTPKIVSEQDQGSPQKFSTKPNRGTPPAIAPKPTRQKDQSNPDRGN